MHPALRSVEKCNRLVGDSLEVVVATQLSHWSQMDCYRARDAIAEGSRSGEASLPQLENSRR